MEANPEDDGNTKRENDFKLISDELKRQFDLMTRVDDSRNVKLSIILGFIMVVIVQIALTTGYANIVIAKPAALVFFAIGFLAAVCAFCLGFIAVYPKDYYFGPNIPKLTKQWKNKEQKDYIKNIFGMMWHDYKKDKQIIQDKAENIKLMLWIFTIGLVFIILSRMVLW